MQEIPPKFEPEPGSQGTGDPDREAPLPEEYGDGWEPTFTWLRENRVFLNDLPRDRSVHVRAYNLVKRGSIMFTQLRSPARWAGCYMMLRPLTYGRTEFVLSEPFDPSYYPVLFTYRSLSEGILAFTTAWAQPDPIDPLPTGWVRYVNGPNVLYPEGEPYQEPGDPDNPDDPEDLPEPDDPGDPPERYEPSDDVYPDYAGADDLGEDLF